MEKPIQTGALQRRKIQSDKSGRVTITPAQNSSKTSNNINKQVNHFQLTGAPQDMHSFGIKSAFNFPQHLTYPPRISDSQKSQRDFSSHDFLNK